MDSPVTGALWGINNSWAGPSSVHSGGINALMCDGSVRFINSSIQMYVPASQGDRVRLRSGLCCALRNGASQLNDPPIGDF